MNMPAAVNLLRVWSVCHKEFLHVVRDPRSLGMAIAIPLLLLLLFGYALTFDVDNVPMIVWDQSRSYASRDFISRFGSSKYFSIRGYAVTYAEVQRAIDIREALVALVIPTDFERRIDSGRETSVQLIVDGSDPNTATIATGYAEAVARTYSDEMKLQDAWRRGERAAYRPLDVRPRVWYNADLESRNYIVPGLIAVIMMVITAMLTSLTVAREWEQGTMEQLISTPVKGAELVVGKLLPYFAIGLFDVLVAVLVGKFLLHVPLRGSVALLFATAGIFLTGMLSMGILISIASKTQLLASQFAMLATFLPAFLLSGFMFAIVNMPKPIQVISYVVPAKYFVSLLKGIYMKGVGLKSMWMSEVFLVAFSVLMLALAILRFKKKLA